MDQHDSVVDVPHAGRLARSLTDGLVRSSVGIEDPGDVIADLEQTFADLG